jgi:polyisoprenoid-binding protein YceI
MTTATQTRTQARSTWTIDAAHSLIEFSAKHMMFTTVKGRFTGVTGTITLDEADLSRSSVEVAIDAASIVTGDEKRDAHLRSADFLDAETYPQLTFKSTRVERVSAERARVVGDLTIHGTTRQVTLDTALNGQGTNPWGMTVAGFTAETTINRKDFGLIWNVALETGGVLVGETIKILLEVQAVRQA